MISKENATIIRALNNYGRVPEQHELLDEIEQLQQELQRKDNNWNELKKYLEKQMKIWDKGVYLTYKEVLDKIKELEKM